MIGRIFRGLALVVAALVVLVGALFAAARFHDGPLGPIPGGPLVAGELVDAPVADWKFASDVQEIEMQLAYENRSRTTWVLVDGAKAYIPCTLEFPPGKRWYKAADQNGDAIVRIAGKRYPVTLKRVQDAAQIESLGKVAVAKYPAAARSRGSAAWFFELEPRASGG